MMNQENHKDLVNIIRGVHEKLRKSLFLTGNPDKVWKDHIADENLRLKYSSAMFKLATEVWNEKESRINWTYNTCVTYFLNGGIERSLLRELKIQRHWSPEQTEKLECLHYVSSEENNYQKINRKLKLLDVGSCFNPFSKFSIFSCLAIDLTPATKDVLQCDFLTLKIHNLACGETADLSDAIFSLESFDIVVFSLVLEYLPAADQRVEFCFKAWKLLQRNGLLIIITPDSKSLQHNAPMMKSWKIALEQIGFIRIKYDKLTHLHCMAFRKVSNSISNNNVNYLSNLMYIPQDFKKYDVTMQYAERNEDEDYHMFQQFSELPNDM